MPSMSYEDNRTYYDYDAATGEFYPQGSQSHLGDPTMDMGVVMLWLLLRILVIILPLLVMMRVLQAMRERRAMEDQSLMVELQHVDLARIFQVRAMPVILSVSRLLIMLPRSSGS